MEVVALETVPTAKLPGTLVVANRRTGLAAAAVVVIAVVVIAALWTQLKQRAVSGLNLPVKSIAVLPFKVVGAKSGDEHIGLGLADVLITRLSNIANERQTDERGHGLDGQGQVSIRPDGS